jgi:hypothetical protein
MLHFCIQNTRPWFVCVTLVQSTIFCVYQVIKSNWNKQVCSLSTIFIEASPKIYMIWTPFYLACALSPMKPLKLGFVRPNLNVTSSPHDTLSFYGFKLHVANYNGEHFTLHWVVNITHEHVNTIKHQPIFLQSPLGCIRLTKSIPLAGP